MRLIKYYLLFLVCVLGACKQQAPKITNDNSEKEIQEILVHKNDLVLNPQKGQWFYNDKPFNGYGFKVYEDGSISEKTGYFNGKREGEDIMYFNDGSIKRTATYIDNQLDGKKISYLKNGQIISESNYVNGKRHGVQKVWYTSGQLAKQRNLKNGIEDGLQKAWLENGTIYVNYEAKNGRIFGMRRANLCYQLKNENTEKSTKI